ncbi:hypothetical protein ROP_40120 [Rhodococcus opacus B4]|uniref:Uncharacterized protein n=1 Tax=Rhodococcus opacus (strain B4) TaxID=632772 RepID=C1B9A6_RHOOB|nr:hypothetical protein ROP_40120 [Rhodococcus opacus B4]
MGAINIPDSIFTCTQCALNPDDNTQILYCSGDYNHGRDHYWCDDADEIRYSWREDGRVRREYRR